MKVAAYTAEATARIPKLGGTSGTTKLTVRPMTVEVAARQADSSTAR